MRFSLLLGAMVASTAASAQVVWTNPAFPSADDQVTLYYDATQGNGELSGIIPVYIHTVLIIMLSCPSCPRSSSVASLKRLMLMHERTHTH